MKNEWIIDVLADLNSFAKANGYPALAKQLEETAILASVEMTPLHMTLEPVTQISHRKTR